MEPDGLIYFPSHYTPPLGHAGFEVRLSGAPRRRYFDAHRISFPIEQAGMLRRLIVEHPYRLAPKFRFVCGRIRIDAHDGDNEEVVTFGGRGTVIVEDNDTVCRVTSTAPFLPLNIDFQSPIVLLESELEIVLAMCRARWGREEYHHLDNLGEADPMAIFVSSIKTLEDRLEGLARAEADPASRRTLHLARAIHRQLEESGEWPTTPVGLADLL